MRKLPSIRSIRLFIFALLIVCISVGISSSAFSQIGIAVSFGPPALPVYEQPPCPDDGYIWTPGYWAYDNDVADYYWVPGTWIEAPEVGLLWTPGYWGWRDNAFFFNEGYWGQTVGFYGGISYGYGYFGEGFQGGRWDNGHFFYNRSVANVNVTNIHNVYNTTVVNSTTITRVSYNGGSGGVTARPRPEDEAAMREKHIAPVAAQTQHMQTARANPQMRAKANQGKPPIAATPKAGAFNDRAAVPAKEAGEPYRAPANRGAAEPGAQTEAARPETTAPATHAKDLQPHPRPEPPNTGNPKADQKYAQQQQKLYAQQEQDHQKLQQKQEQDHQQLAQQKASPQKTQQVEQKHQQQTQQMEQKHTQQQQQMQTRQPPAKSQPKPPERKD